MSGVQVKIDEAIASRIRISDALKFKEKEFKDLKAALKEQMLTIDSFLLGQAEAMGTTSFKTDAGTAFIDHPDFVSVTEWSEFLKFLSNSLGIELSDGPDPDEIEVFANKIFKSDVWVFFNHSVSKSAIKEFMDQHEGLTPAGITYGTKKEMKVRRPTKVRST